MRFHNWSFECNIVAGMACANLLAAFYGDLEGIARKNEDFAVLGATKQMALTVQTLSANEVDVRTRLLGPVQFVRVISGRVSVLRTDAKGENASEVFGLGENEALLFAPGDGQFELRRASDEPARYYLLLASEKRAPLVSARKYVPDPYAPEAKFSTYYKFTDIEASALRNKRWRHVSGHFPEMQVVFQTLACGERVPAEVHTGATQFVFVVGGKALIRIGLAVYRMLPDFAVMIPEGTEHEIVQIGDDELSFYTLYSVPQHTTDLERQPKSEAEEEGRIASVVAAGALPSMSGNARDEKTRERLALLEARVLPHIDFAALCATLDVEHERPAASGASMRDLVLAEYGLSTGDESGAESTPPAVVAAIRKLIPRMRNYDQSNRVFRDIVAFLGGPSELLIDAAANKPAPTRQKEAQQSLIRKAARFLVDLMQFDALNLGEEGRAAEKALPDTTPGFYDTARPHPGWLVRLGSEAFSVVIGLAYFVPGTGAIGRTSYRMFIGITPSADGDRIEFQSMTGHPLALGIKPADGAIAFLAAAQRLVATKAAESGDHGEPYSHSFSIPAIPTD